jgi:hypothetical protein
MEVVETAIFTEFMLGCALSRAKVIGKLREGRPSKKTIENDDSFSLKSAGLTLDESSHAQRLYEFATVFGVEWMREFVTKQKEAGVLSRSGVYRTIDQALRRREHQQRRDEPIGSLEGLYEIILADPPWQYDVASTESRAIENQYQTATLEQIKLHIPEAAQNSVLFLWATAQPGWYRQGVIIVMGCCCGVAALNYAKLPFFPQTDWEWLEWLSEADNVMKLHSERDARGPFSRNISQIGYFVKCFLTWICGRYRRYV